MHFELSISFALIKKLWKQKSGGKHIYIMYFRVIVSVLDNFHFDLSKSTLNVKTTPVPKIERDAELSTDTTGKLKE